jgi:hypothetical protein
VADVAGIAGHSVNAGVAAPPVAVEEPEEPWAAAPTPALWVALPAECLALILDGLGVVALATCARACRRMHATCVLDGLWIARAIRAGIDWASVPPCGRSQLHCVLGPRLRVFEANTAISLRLLSPQGLEDCLIDQPSGGGRGVVWPPSNVRAKHVTIDMQMPLSNVTEPFEEELHAEDRRMHDENERPYPFHRRSFHCFQGRPDSFAGGSMFAGQSINPRFSAWHYQLTSGEVISFTEKYGLVD